MRYLVICLDPSWTNLGLGGLNVVSILGDDPEDALENRLRLLSQDVPQAPIGKEFLVVNLNVQSAVRLRVNAPEQPAYQIERVA